jgi:hypothetical protein
MSEAELIFTALAELENKTGKKIVSNENYLSLQK